MVVYRRCRRSELAKFAKDRGIQVQPSGKRPNRPLKRDLTAALRDADADRTFRFLDLPPELRNMVYRELLIMAPAHAYRLASPKCQPQILCASKEIHQEARGILYGDNVIQVIIHPTGVYAHGIRCGTYLPQPPANAQQPNQRMAEDLKWPDFLHRAQLVGVASFGMLRGHANRLKLPNCGTLHNILFSLCDFLQVGTSLKYITVDLAWLTNQYLTWGYLNALMDHLHVAVYPLRMLRNSVAVHIEGTEGTNLHLPLRFDRIAVDGARKVLSGSLPRLCHHLQAILRTGLRLHQAVAFSPIIPEAIMLLTDLLATTLVGIELTFSIVEGRNSLQRGTEVALRFLRDRWDNTPADGVPNALKKALNGVMLLGAEMKRAEREARSG